MPSGEAIWRAVGVGGILLVGAGLSGSSDLRAGIGLVAILAALLRRVSQRFGPGWPPTISFVAPLFASIFGYALASFVFFEDLAGDSEIARILLGGYLSHLCFAFPALTIASIVIYRAQTFRSEWVEKLWPRVAGTAIAFAVGFIVYLPLQLLLIIGYAF